MGGFGRVSAGLRGFGRLNFDCGERFQITPAGLSLRPSPELASACVASHSGEGLGLNPRGCHLGPFPESKLWGDQRLRGHRALVGHPALGGHPALAGHPALRGHPALVGHPALKAACTRRLNKSCYKGSI